MNSYEKRYQKKNGLTSPSASPSKKATFSEAVVNKTDVGEFQEGYFIMSSADETLMRRPHINKNSPQRKKTQYTQPAPTNNYNSDDKPLKPTKQPKAPQQSTETLLTPASLFVNDSDSTPSKKHLASYSNNNNYNNNNNNKSKSYNNNNSGYTTKNNTTPVSPQSSSCWAGGAFNNSPSPNSLPIPNFDDWSSPETTSTPQFDLTSMTYNLRRLLNIQPDLVSAKTVA